VVANGWVRQPQDCRHGRGPYRRSIGRARAEPSDEANLLPVADPSVCVLRMALGIGNNRPDDIDKQFRRASPRSEQLAE
jgi:hypothetical protein